MKELTLVFDSALFEWPVHKDIGKKIIAMESNINDFLVGVETIGVGHCINVHLDWLYEHFKSELDAQYVEWFSLKVIHADYDLRPHEAFSVIIHAGDTLKLKKNEKGDMVSIKLISAEKE